MNIKSAPCATCPKRGCGSYHDECELYLEFKKKREKIREDHIKNCESLNYSRPHVRSLDAYNQNRARVQKRGGLE